MLSTLQPHNYSKFLAGLHIWQSSHRVLIPTSTKMKPWWIEMQEERKMEMSRSILFSSWCHGFWIMHRLPPILYTLWAFRLFYFHYESLLQWETWRPWSRSFPVPHIRIMHTPIRSLVYYCPFPAHVFLFVPLSHWFLFPLLNTAIILTMVVAIASLGGSIQLML